MHEVSIIQDMFDIIEENIENHNIEEVSKIVVKVGEFTCVEEHALTFAFEAISKDTKAENAELIIKRVKATAKCEDCQEIFDISYTNKKCPVCRKFSNNIISGYELILSEIEGE